MDKEPNEIREEIAATRARMSATADALEYKADIPARMKDRVAGAANGAREAVSDRIDAARGAAEHLTPQANPLGLVLGAFAVGSIVGFLLPHTEIEDERLGEVADHAKAQVREAGRELAERGQEAVKAAAQTAVQSRAKDRVN